MLLCYYIVEIRTGYSPYRIANSIGIGAQSTFGGKTFLREKNVRKINRIPGFYTIFARQIIKMPGFLFAPKSNNKIPKFCMIIARKMFPFWRGEGRGGGTCPMWPCLPRLLHLCDRRTDGHDCDSNIGVWLTCATFAMSWHTLAMNSVFSNSFLRSNSQRASQPAASILALISR